MIPIHKLGQLPRHQRLRKCSRIMAEADAEAASIERGEREATYPRLRYIADACALIAGDPEFDAARRGAIGEAARELAGLSSAAMNGGKVSLPRRPINLIRHVLASEIGEMLADWDLVDLSGRLSREQRISVPGVRIFLEDIRSPFNVGSIFRTAESFTVEKVLVSPLCAAPDHPRAVRTAMGCTDLLEWERTTLQELTGPVFALETGGASIDGFGFPMAGTMIIGSEELGISPAALELADRSLGRVSIPTYGAKGSLNVAVAFGIAMRAWAERLVGTPFQRDLRFSALKP